MSSKKKYQLVNSKTDDMESDTFRNHYQKTDTSIIPKIDIAVVGNKSSGKTTLIKFWLTLSPDSLIVSDTFSKIIWIENQPVQINIKEISDEKKKSSWLYLRQNKKYQAVVYVNNLDKSFSENSIDSWIEYMQDKISIGAYQTILGLTFKNLDESDYADMENIKMIYSAKQINYFIGSLLETDTNQTNISRIIGLITAEAYTQLSRSVIENTNSPDNIYSDRIEKDIYEMSESGKSHNLPSREPLLGQYNHHSTKKYSCCIIL